MKRLPALLLPAVLLCAPAAAQQADGSTVESAILDILLERGRGAACEALGR
jgi:hypothetical protein